MKICEITKSGGPISGNFLTVGTYCVSPCAARAKVRWRQLKPVWSERRPGLTDAFSATQYLPSQLSWILDRRELS